MSKKTGYSETIECRHCSNVAPMRMVGTATDDKYEDFNLPRELIVTYEILSCPKCEEVTIRDGHWEEGTEEDEWVPSILYPPKQKRLLGLPSQVEQEYLAAQKIKAITPNGFAVLSGRVIDSVCIDRGASGRSLHDRLNDLADRQEIPAHLADMAQQLRQLRNVGAHADLGSLTDEEIPVLEALCQAVLEYVYEAPRLVKIVESRLATIKTANC